MTSLPDRPLEPPNLAFIDSLADEPYSNILNMNQLSPSAVPLEANKPAHGKNILASPDEDLAPGYNVPFIALHSLSPSSEPTDVSPEDFYPTNTMEVDWGSGDYLETMSFPNANEEDYGLVTKVPSYDSYDQEDYTESYDTSFPSRVGIAPSSSLPLAISPSPSLMVTFTTTVPLKSIDPSFASPTTQYALEPTPTPTPDEPDVSDIDWLDTFTIQPTDVLLPDMNSLEYYTTKLTKENGSDTVAEHRGNITVVPISTTDITPTSTSTNDTKVTDYSSDLSGFEPHDESSPEETTEESPQLVSSSEPTLEPSIVPTSFLDHSSSGWSAHMSTTDWAAPTLTMGLESTTALSEALLPTSTPLLPDTAMTSSSLTDVHWFITEPSPQSTIHATPVLSATAAFSPFPTEPAANATASETDLTPYYSPFTTQETFNDTSVSTELESNVTSVLPDVLGDQGVSEDGGDIPATVTSIPTRSEANTLSAAPTTTTVSSTSHQATAKTSAATQASTSVSIMSTTSAKTTTTATTSRQYLCNIDRPAYLTKIGTSDIGSRSCCIIFLVLH